MAHISRTSHFLAWLSSPVQEKPARKTKQSSTREWLLVSVLHHQAVAMYIHTHPRRECLSLDLSLPPPRRCCWFSISIPTSLAPCTFTHPIVIISENEGETPPRRRSSFSNLSRKCVSQILRRRGVPSDELPLIEPVWIGSHPFWFFEWDQSASRMN